MRRRLHQQVEMNALEMWAVHQVLDRRLQVCSDGGRRAPAVFDTGVHVDGRTPPAVVELVLGDSDASQGVTVNRDECDGSSHQRRVHGHAGLINPSVQSKLQEPPA